MESMSHPHWETLTPATLQAFHQVARLPFITGFYLAGGTGLALHLGHRFSVDLDFFSSDEAAVGPDQRDALRLLLNDPSLAITYDKAGTFVATWQGVGVSFFRLPLYPLVQQPVLLEGVPLATVLEIGAMKLAAIIDRGTRKDMVDLYYLLQVVSLETIFEVAAVKYARVRSFPVSAMRALAYFADAEALPMPRMLDKTPWAKMKKFLERQAMDAGRKNLADLWK
ncbi:MAG: nucleotidyl transferase AbiEii/AbiGii toxin family protein [Anaerolineales bacterium]|nr:nucleotidyl transferase AbiEii/AbiGii toxin family protein [Anaerolineales bacterium]